MTKPRDTVAPDGVVAHGWRLVRPGGRVKFWHSWWQHEALVPYVGKYVLVYPNEYWVTGVVCFDLDKPSANLPICKIGVD